MDKLKWIPISYFKSMRNGIIEENDILIVKDGATTGKVSFIKNFPYSCGAINEHVFKIKTKPNAFPKYVFYYLFSDRGKGEILKDFRGATVGGISKKFCDKVIIPLPPLETQ